MIYLPTDFFERDLKSYLRNQPISRIDRNKSGEISKDEIVILNLLKYNHRAIKNEIIIKTNFSSRKIDRLIKNLKSKGLIKRIGSNKTGYWDVLK